MFDNINLQGKTESEQDVTVTKGEFTEITLDCGSETVVLSGLITKVQRSLKVSTVVAFRVEEPGKAAYEVTSQDSPSLYNSDGSEREVPADTVVTPVPGGKAF